jgi:quercetin dioxygenase-like cupin family protein
MAFSGQVLDNPIGGERFIFHQTADDTAGALLAFDLVVSPDGRVPGGHIHPVQQESFEVLSGTMKFRKGPRTVVARPGDTVVVPPGAFHQFANAGDEPSVVRVRVEPALRMEQLYETAAALASEGRTLRSGMPKPLDLAVFMRELEQEVRAPVAPGLVRAVLAPLAWVAARRGLDQRYRVPAGLAGRRPAPTHPGAGRVAGTRPGPARRPRPGLAARGPPAAGPWPLDETEQFGIARVDEEVNRHDGVVLARTRRRSWHLAVDRVDGAVLGRPAGRRRVLPPASPDPGERGPVGRGGPGRAVRAR